MILLNAEQVLVTVGTPWSVSAVGTTETYKAKVRGEADYVGWAGFDAGLVEFAADGSLQWRDGGGDASLEAIEEGHGSELRRGSGIRHIPELTRRGQAAITDIAAALPHDLDRGGLRRLAGLDYDSVRNSDLRQMHGLFDDDPRLGPSLQAQMFAYTGLGSLAALPVPLSELLPDPYDFRVAAATAFSGMDSLGELRAASDLDYSQDTLKDRFAMRLANSLASHGPALLSTMLAPSYPLSKSLRNPGLLDGLRGADGYMRVPQTPLNTVGACASSSIALCELAPQMLLNYPGFHRPQLALWTAADAATRPEWQMLDAFGPGALMTGDKLAALNVGRGVGEVRRVGESLAPFDIDANGTVVGEGGSGLLITTLDFALRNHLDVTSIITGWGQSGEAGGKAHFAGVGFGGENAIIHALDLAWKGHGYGVNDFDYLVAHATGTRTNSKTDLTTTLSGRLAASRRQGAAIPLTPMRVGTPKAVGDGHTMGETGLKAVSQGIEYLLGNSAVGVPTLRQLDPELEGLADAFEISSDLVAGNNDGGVICATQGFGGYNGAITMRAANPDSISRYQVEPSVLADYLERWPQIRQERERRELEARRESGVALRLAQQHRWSGLD